MSEELQLVQVELAGAVLEAQLRLLELLALRILAVAVVVLLMRTPKVLVELVGLEFV